MSRTGLAAVPTGVPAAVPAALLMALLMGMLSACRQPPDPSDPDLPPEPQAAHTELRDAVQAPLEQARAVEADVQQAADAQRAAIEAAGG